METTFINNQGNSKKISINYQKNTLKENKYLDYLEDVNKSI